MTVAVPVKNEEANIARCLERLGRFEEIVIIDSGSTDRTREIAEGFGARVVDFQWNGEFPKKRNWFLMNKPIATPWVLFLDADEYVDDAFCDALEAAVTREDIHGYWLHYDNFFLGKPIRHGLVQRKLALFRVGKALYERIDEHNWSALDMEIHEHPIVEGKVGEIDARIDHRDFKGLAHFISKHRDYAQWEARRYALMRDEPETWTQLTDRQKFKYTHLTKWWYPPFYFAFTFIAKRGFLDGSAGFHYAMYKAWYFQTIRLLIQEYAAEPALQKAI
ncbi:glycosyltransferase family 2 protein [Rhodovulum marinum]|uniref:glycosyltransferase family 2 protein n=1 Tax=Rhodovulum marinum TaxID=320662 RepID=UPI001A9D6C2D|nr:glycosyltransferase family 2 protein [Rhodovulum marinum]